MYDKSENFTRNAKQIYGNLLSLSNYKLCDLGFFSYIFKRQKVENSKHAANNKGVPTYKLHIS